MRRILLLLSISAVVPAVGCTAPAVTLRRLQPAQVNNLPRTLGVLDVQGGVEQVPVAQSALVDQLRASGFYTLFDEAALRELARGPLRLADGTLNMPVARAAAQQLGIDALLLTRLQIQEAGGIPYGSVTVRVGDPKIAARLQYELIDARSGQLLGQETIVSDTWQGELTPAGSGSSSETRVLTGLTRQAAGRLAQELAPYTSEVEVRLAGKALGRGVEEIRRGNKAARAGNWEKAVEEWNEAIQDDPRNHAAWYNVGLAFEASHRYEHARQAFERALKIHNRALYHEAVERCLTAATQYREAIAQRSRTRNREGQLARQPQPAPPRSQGESGHAGWPSSPAALLRMVRLPPTEATGPRLGDRRAAPQSPGLDLDL